MSDDPRKESEKTKAEKEVAHQKQFERMDKKHPGSKGGTGSPAKDKPTPEK
jgi:hypothetical protein